MFENVSKELMEKSPGGRLKGRSHGDSQTGRD